MTNHIDLGTVLRQTLSASLYSNLVTRPTGAAVRTQIETMLADTLGAGRALTVIDFSHVQMIDFSCADEIIAKLLMSHVAQGRESYFVFRGMTDDHWAAIETVLERHGLALVVERDTGLEIVGVLTNHERSAWDMLKERGRVALADLASGSDDESDPVHEALEGLWRRRLIMRANDMYVPVGELA
jgi:hypothetical protein